MAGLQNYLGELNHALRRLDQQWEATAAVWDDDTRRRFEEHHWTLLVHQHRNIAQRAANLADALSQAQRSLH